MLPNLCNTMNQSKKWKISIFFIVWVNWKIFSIGPKSPAKNPRISSNDPGDPWELCKSEKTALKNLNEKKYRPSKNEDFEAFERWVTLLSNKIYKRILDEKWPIMLILGVFFPHNYQIWTIKRFIRIYYFRNIFDKF